MKKLTSIILSLCMIFALISAFPAVNAEGENMFGLVSELTDGKEYILIWNSEYTDNSGDKHALAESSGVFGNNTLSDKYFRGDNIELSVYYEHYVWIAHEDNGNWRFENKTSGEYLAYDTEVENGLVLSNDSASDNTLWLYKKSSSGYSLIPKAKTSYRIRYSVSGECLKLQENTSSNSYVYLYELGAEACPEHVYFDCLDTTCESCGNISRSKTGLSHTYSETSDSSCNDCGFERYIFPDTEVALNEAVRTVSAVFYRSSSSTQPTDDYKNYFNLTSLIASVAPFEDVTHVEITLEASDTEGYSNTAPFCRLYFNGWQGNLAGNESFENSNTVSFSVDIPEEGAESIWLMPSNFVAETEISFKATVKVTYNASEEPDYGEPLASIVSFSDYQLWSNNQLFGTNWTGLRAQLGDIFTAMSKRVDPDYIIFGGDYTGEMNVKPASDMGRKEILKEISLWWPHINGENGRYIQIKGNHDPDDIEGMLETGPIEFENVIVYTIQENDFPCGMSGEDDKQTVEATANALKKYLNQKIRSGETRPIIIATHLGLHYEARTGSNTQYIYILFDVINKAAEDLDIIFMHGHYHSTGDPEGGGAIVYKGVGETIKVADESCFDEEGDALQDKAGYGRESVLNFTYMNYGYVGFVGSGLTDMEIFSHLEPETVLTASELNVYDDFITMTRYSAAGRLSEFSHVIERAHADARPKLLPQDYIYVFGGAAIVLAIGLLITAAVLKNKAKKKK